jgi:hypothetical protein
LSKKSARKDITLKRTGLKDHYVLKDQLEGPLRSKGTSLKGHYVQKESDSRFTTLKKDRSGGQYVQKVLAQRPLR